MDANICSVLKIPTYLRVILNSKMIGESNRTTDHLFFPRTDNCSQAPHNLPIGQRANLINNFSSAVIDE